MIPGRGEEGRDLIRGYKFVMKPNNNGKKDRK